MKTASMSKFDYLYLGALIVQLFVFIAGWDWLVMDIHNQVALGGGGPDAQVFVAGLLPTIVAITFAISLGIWMLISVARWGFVRYILALLVLLSALSLVAEVIEPTMNVYFFAAYAIILAMNIAALYFVFQPDAGAWIRRET
ncbi:hypothetical protein [Erythrobacter ani]|uniref:Uncharacterized protein n=1 Tax=Erythrobacter ani TaxID=2827235 RepID=A0ABS6SKK2_9SPHN|nr:hypothetical protein [Erythrobacter ani]MBV7265515.1 hypothetical protein [Erythrobacter ani]